MKTSPFDNLIIRNGVRDVMGLYNLKEIQERFRAIETTDKQIIQAKADALVLLNHIEEQGKSINQLADKLDYIPYIDPIPEDEPLRRFLAKPIPRGEVALQEWTAAAKCYLEILLLQIDKAWEAKRGPMRKREAYGYLFRHPGSKAIGPGMGPGQHLTFTMDKGLSEVFGTCPKNVKALDFVHGMGEEGWLIEC